MVLKFVKVFFVSTDGKSTFKGRGRMSAFTGRLTFWILLHFGFPIDGLEGTLQSISHSACTEM